MLGHTNATPCRQQNAERSADGTMGGSGIQAAKCLPFNLFQIGHLGAIWIVRKLRQTRAEQEIRTKGAAMFGITTETIRQFSLAEILLLIAMNIETSRLGVENRARLETGTSLSS
jgi:hypothetical protein